MRIALLGDLGLFGKYTVDNPNIENYFREISNFLADFDVVVGNLEVPLCHTTRAAVGKSAHLRSSPNNVELLKYLNVSHVSLSNNHMFDFGIKGAKETISVLESAGMEYFGVNNKISKIELNGSKIALSGYTCYSTNALGYLENGVSGVNELDYDKVLEDLMSNRSKGFLNISSFHIGEEHVHYPNLVHVKLARKLSDNLEYVFYGHHPHVLQGYEEYGSSLHFYSLGNFCFDDVYTSKSKKPLVVQTEANKESCIVSLTIEDNKILEYEVISIIDDGQSIKIPKQSDILVKLKKYSEYLKLDHAIYNKRRNEVLDSYIQSRKNKRDFTWYLKRLRFSSLKLILDSRRNRKKLMKVLSEKV